MLRNLSPTSLIDDLQSYTGYILVACTASKVLFTVVEESMYCCEAWPRILRENHRLKVFEKRVQREYLDQREMK
jgi:hypothetical protein